MYIQKNEILNIWIQLFIKNVLNTMDNFSFAFDPIINNRRLLNYYKYRSNKATYKINYHLNKAKNPSNIFVKQLYHDWKLDSWINASFKYKNQIDSLQKEINADK